MNRVLSSARRLANACFGAGPWRIAPFAAIASGRMDEAPRGVHRPESFAGIVHQENDLGCNYPARVALLQQSDRGEMLADGPRYLGPGVCAAIPKKLFALSDAGIAGRDGVVYCPRQRAAVAETVRCWTDPALSHPLLGAARFPSAVKLPGLSLSLATLDAEGFYHFLLEALPRLWLGRDYLASVDHFFVSGPPQPSHLAWLARAGVPTEKIIWLDGHGHFRCEQLLFSHPPFHEYQPTHWVRESLCQLFHTPTNATGQRWIWISRSDARTRHMLWEDSLLARFPRFEKIVLSPRPVPEQITLFAGADVIAGPHGAGLANLVFAAHGVRFAEFFPPGQLQPVYSRLAQVAGGRAAWAQTDFTAPGDLEKVSAALAEFLAV